MKADQNDPATFVCHGLLQAHVCHEFRDPVAADHEPYGAHGDAAFIGFRPDHRFGSQHGRRAAHGTARRCRHANLPGRPKTLTPSIAPPANVVATMIASVRMPVGSAEVTSWRLVFRVFPGRSAPSSRRCAQGRSKMAWRCIHGRLCLRQLWTSCLKENIILRMRRRYDR
jgi:hypothetical protein